MNVSNSYLTLTENFYEKIRPAPVRSPRLLLWNSSLAKQLMMSKELEQDPAALAQFFSGNRILPGSEPIALAYAGHQFGHFVPQLGDGRAHLLGDVLDQSGKKFDIQLKGSGPTRFARGGDGRCAVGPAVREFIMSEAMNALGVPTTRCLAVVTTGESVFRESALPGAVVTRVASSHIRIGTFQFFAARSDHESLRALSDLTIERHFPDLREEGPDKYTGLLDKVIERQIQLVAQWMRVGFIHGVMNTDNTALSGETIDYGPCAMMGNYDPQTVYSSIDTMGRYAFGNQSKVAHWNITRFAECLLPLINADRNKAIAKVEPLISEFPDRFNQVYNETMGKKLGLTSFQQEDQKLLFSVLNRLKEHNMDYTNSFDLLTKSLMSEVLGSQAKDEFGECYDLWQKRLSGQPENSQAIHDLMRQHNPVVIPRNHHVEAVIQDCQQNGKVTSAENFLNVLRSPYEALAATSQYQDPPMDGDKDYQTFCGT
jgi:uncharacterized protein YdiU (UPF0061 family)